MEYWDMLLLFTAFAAGCVAQPENTTPGGILNTNCIKGCTEIAVHEANCYPPCDSNLYERCVLIPRHVEPSCENSSSDNHTTSMRLSKRPYGCRCHPCLYRSHTGLCVPACPESEEEA